MNPSWDDLRTLEAFGRLGSAGKAARELGVSAATVYRRIAALEEEVGSKCILRGDGAQLSEVGARLAAVGATTRGALAEASRLNALGDTRVGGRIGLTTVDGFVPLLGQPLRQLAQDHPELIVEVHISDRGPSVRKRAVEMSVSVMHQPPEVLWGRRLFEIEYGVYGTPGRVADATLRWITLAGEAANSPIGRWEEVHSEVVAASTNSRALSLEMVQQGLGVIVMPRRLGAVYTDLVEVRSYRRSLEELRVPAWLLTHPDIREHPRVTVLMAALTEALADGVSQKRDAQSHE